MGTFLSIQAKEGLPGAFCNPAEMTEVFQRRSTECLIIAKYFTAPGPYTMEALMMNVQNEFIRRRDSHLGVWFLTGVGIRLALHMGYHRDPAGYSQFSAFQGEMRRRIVSNFQGSFSSRISCLGVLCCLYLCFVKLRTTKYDVRSQVHRYNDNC
jgi:hypothetical protein